MSTVAPSLHKNLCGLCLTSFQRAEKDKAAVRNRHHPNYKSLQSSATSGCYICLALCNRFEESAGAKSLDFEFPTSFTIWHGGGTGDKGVVGVDFSSSFAKANFRIVPVSESGVLDSGKSSSSSSNCSLMVAQQWLKTCKSSHRLCNPRIDGQVWVPSRLIDIGLVQSDSTVLRILITKNDSRIGPYITLSHRWGNKSFPMLTTSSLSSMKNGFSESILPKTFRDAILVARKFNVRYLWIDCLCIIQDSPSDFEVEAALMHQVYGNSYLNISATGALSNDDGLFFDRNPNLIYPTVVWLDFKELPSGLYSVINEDHWGNGIWKAPINQRAWVVQERILAPRVLHFGKEQLLWECRESEACESCPLGMSQRLLKYGTNKRSYLDGFDTEDEPERKAAIRKSWHKTVSLYTRSALTYQGDKLIALAGVASRVHEALECEYLAGLWSCFLPDDLLWTLEPRLREHAPRPEKYRSPSWSWAAVDGHVSMQETLGRPDLPRETGKGWPCSILEASVVPSTEDEFGALSSGFLRVQGALKRIIITGESKNTNLIRLDCYIDGEHLRNLEAEFDDLLPPFKHETYCICVQAYGDTWFSAQKGLFLRHTGVGKGEYCRIGIFATVHQIDVDILDTSENGLEAQYPCESYNRVTKQHIFTIV